MSDEKLLRTEVERWIADDPDPVTQAELEHLLGAQHWPGLRARFAEPLVFGTAGMRGEIGAGPARMNRVVVARATAGLCAQLIAEIPRARERGLCIGYDGRHGSREFAEETAQVAAGFGIRVQFFEQPCPTPLLGFAMLDCGAAGAVMVTASHNPARDNGYKVYWENGAQIVPPQDVAIAQQMAAVTSVRALARVPAAERLAQGLEQRLGKDMERRYLDAVRELVGGRVPSAGNLRVVYTALHGVGAKMVLAALAEAGFDQVSSVEEQADPHPDFPTVAFPNPEEPGAMDRALALGERVQADLVIANDPDADRLALAARDSRGVLRMFTGNQVGVMLADHLLASDTSRAPRTVLTSLVSTPMIASIARAHGAHWEPTLTGFKWIANRAMQLERQRSLRFVFGFEEALGYTAGTLVRDKDGVSSAVLAARLAAQLKAQDRTLHDLLGDLFRQHGVYLSGQVSLRVEAEDQRKLMRAARAQPPDMLAGSGVTAVIDLLDGSVRGTASFAPALPKSDALLWELAGGHRICVRPSGTEPKLKLYVDVCEPVRGGEPIAAAQQRAEATLAALTADVKKRFGA